MSNTGKGTLFLGGGGSDAISKTFDRSFVEKLMGKKRILYIPIAWSTDPKTYPGCFEWFINMARQIGFGDKELCMASSLTGPEVKELKSFDAVYIGGGNTYNLLHAVKTLSFDQKLLRFLKDGGTVYGGSAGAIIMGRSISTVIEENDLGDAGIHEGLNLLSGLSVRCHFAPKEQKFVDEHLKRFPSQPIVVLPESSGLIVTNTQVVVGGEEPVQVFLGKQQVLTFQPGQTLTVGK